MAKTDTAAEIGMHVFEHAHLGVAPFRCIGMVEKVHQPIPNMPAMAGGSCAYCSTGIRYCFVIRDRNGKTFEVGSDCVAKTGDAGLIKSFKARPEVRALNREKAKARDVRVQEAWVAMMANPADVAKLDTFTVDVPEWKGGGREAWTAYAKRAWGYCGASGRARYLKAAKALLSKINTTTLIAA